MMRSTALVLGVGLLGVLSACVATDGPDVPEPSASGPDSTPPAATSPAPSVEPTAEGVMELEVTGEPLPAGRYTRSAFEPSVSFELDGSWQAVQAGSGFFDVQQLIGTPDVIAVQFGRVYAVPSQDGDVVPADAAEASDLVATNDDVVTVERGESRIGGLTGSQITVANEGRSHAQVIDVLAGGLGIDPGRRLWMAFFEHPEGLVVVMVGGSSERWQDALDAAEPVLESIEFGR